MLHVCGIQLYYSQWIFILSIFQKNLQYPACFSVSASVVCRVGSFLYKTNTMPLRDQAVGSKLSAVCTGLEGELYFIWSSVTDGAPAKITDLY